MGTDPVAATATTPPARSTRAPDRATPGGPTAHGLLQVRRRRARPWATSRFVLRLPVPVERALDLDEPDERPDDRQEEPETGPARERRRSAVLLVHLPDLGRNEEPGDDRDHDVDHEAEHSADALAGVVLDLVLGLEDPVERVDPERDDRRSGSRSRCLSAARAGLCSSQVCPWRSILAACSQTELRSAPWPPDTSFEERWRTTVRHGRAQRHARQLLRRRPVRRPGRCDRARADGWSSEGAALVDVGGESTRPGAAPISAEEELARVEPVLEGLRGLPISIDTSKAVGRATRARARRRARERRHRASRRPGHGRGRRGGDAFVCLMHMQGEPRTMQVAPRYDDVVSDVLAFLEERVAFAVESGIAEERICVDPGIGFGKTPDQNLELLRRLDALARARPSGARRRLAQEHARQDPRRRPARRPEASRRRSRRPSPPSSGVRR